MRRKVSEALRRRISCKTNAASLQKHGSFYGLVRIQRFLGGGTRNILDMACGAGANILYMGNRHEKIQFVGMDISKEFIDYGNRMLEQYSQYNNCKLYEGDWFNMDTKWKGAFDGIISFQTVLMFPDYREALSKLADLQPEWIAFSSLFYEGDIEYTNKFRNYYRPSEGKEYTECYYNIHSMPLCKEYMKTLGYPNFEYMPFEIDIDIPKIDSMDIGTYTVKTVEGKRMQISAGMMMPWYFVIAYK